MDTHRARWKCSV